MLFWVWYWWRVISITVGVKGEEEGAAAGGWPHPHLVSYSHLTRRRKTYFLHLRFIVAFINVSTTRRGRGSTHKCIKQDKRARAPPLNCKQPRQHQCSCTIHYSTDWAGRFVQATVTVWMCSTWSPREATYGTVVQLKYLMILLLIFLGSRHRYTYISVKYFR